MIMEMLSSCLNNYFSCVVGVFVFSGAFSQPGFHFFPADKVDEHVGRQRTGVTKVIQVGLPTRGWRDIQACRDSWVEVDSLDQPQNPQ